MVDIATEIAVQSAKVILEQRPHAVCLADDFRLSSILLTLGTPATATFLVINIKTERDGVPQISMCQLNDYCNFQRLSDDR